MSDPKTQHERKGLLGWFASNHVAANLLMYLIIVGGILTIWTIKIEIFPDMELDVINVTVPYRGATPADAEKGVCLRVEEAIAGIDGIKRITSTASEGSGTTVIEVEEYAETQEVLDDVKAAIDRITTFPVETEKPIIAEIKHTHRVITVVVSGNVTEKTLRKISEEIRDELTTNQGLSQVSIWGVRPYEIAVEISENALRRYGLSFDKVSQAVARSSLDIPAGSIKTEGGEILVRTEGQKYYGPDFENIIVLTKNDGTVIKLRDIAAVRDEFEDSDLYCRFDGKNAAMIKIGRIGEQGALDVAARVKEYIHKKQQSLPSGITLSLWEDDSQMLESRINLLKDNGIQSLMIVFVCLLFFLELRLTFWITAGLMVSFLGTVWLMPFWGVTINMMSLFAFIMIVGMEVDDSIVIGENIYVLRQKGLSPLEASIKGVKEMALPVILAVVTTVLAFLPLVFTSGVLGKILRVLPIVVVSVFIISLLEVLLILPSHLSAKPKLKFKPLTNLLEKVQGCVGKRFEEFTNGPFRKAIGLLIDYRYITLATAISLLIITAGLFAAGFIKITFWQPVEADNIVALLEMPQGTALSQTQEVIAKIESAAVQLKQEYDKQGETSNFKHISTTIGTHPALARGGPDERETQSAGEARLGEVNIELLSGEFRKVSAAEMKNRWRQIIGDIPGISSLTFMSEIAMAGDDISIELSHIDFDVLLQASDKLKVLLRQYNGISDISDSFEPGKPEIKLALKESGRMLGLTLSDLAKQVRQGFYGEEAQRIQRGRDDIRVMVRYPQDERKKLSSIENMRIRLPDGTEIPFGSVAEVEYGRGYATINRVDRKRIITVSADVDEETANAAEINQDIRVNVLPGLMAEFDGLQWSTAGAEREHYESMASMKKNFLITLLAIYALLAIQFRSYAQPLIVMTAIPFGMVGAVFGHLLMGFDITILSMFGLIGMAGVAVNDSLITMELMNRKVESGKEYKQIIQDTITRRLRPTMLTTMTTFLGLAPMIMERSLQARFLIPMAISMSFGILASATVTMFVVPALCAILNDAKQLFVKRGNI